VKTIAFFSNKGGVGKTSLVYHLAWMFADLGASVVAADLDPQANLSSMFLDDERLEELWPETGTRRTVFGALRPVIVGTGNIGVPHLEPISDNLALLVGDLEMTSAEDELNAQWPKANDRTERAFRVLSAPWRVLRASADARRADVVLIDVGPSLGAINRAALISAQHVVIPLAPDLYSLQGLRNLGPTLQTWRTQWAERAPKNPSRDVDLPGGAMSPVGYIVMQHAVRRDRPTKAYNKWIERVPRFYSQYVLGLSGASPTSVADDPSCLAALKHYRSLMPLAQEAQKPMFHLKAADGAIAGHAQAVRACYEDFRKLALSIAERCGVPLPPQQVPRD
jgi:chromosome partitioning protein